VQGFANVVDDEAKALCEVALFELQQHLIDLFFPILLPHFLVNAFVAVYSCLVVFNRQVNQRGVALGSLLHFKAEEDLLGPVEGIHKPAVRLYEKTHFTTGTLFGKPDGFQNAGLFFSGEEVFIALPGK